jgi:hypothetical protein
MREPLVTMELLVATAGLMPAIVPAIARCPGRQRQRRERENRHS